MARRHRLPFLAALFGMILGYFLAHPYTMLIYILAHWHESGQTGGGWSLPALYEVAWSSFSPLMFPMSLSFALLGALVGFLIGMVFHKRKLLREAELENERRKAALDTLHQLVVTLSHYLLNADTIIGGMVRRCRRKAGPDKDVVAALDAIEDQAHKVEAVVRALQKVREIHTASYTTDGTVLMLDVTKELQEEMMDGDLKGRST